MKMMHKQTKIIISSANITFNKLDGCDGSILQCCKQI